MKFRIVKNGDDKFRIQRLQTFEEKGMKTIISNWTTDWEYIDMKEYLTLDTAIKEMNELIQTAQKIKAKENILEIHNETEV